MLRRFEAVLIAAAVAMAIDAPAVLAQAAGPNAWQNDLKPIAPADWNYDFAAHLLERAGFGGTPDEIQALAKLTPAQAVARPSRRPPGSFLRNRRQRFASLRSLGHS